MVLHKQPLKKDAKYKAVLENAPTDSDTVKHDITYQWKLGGTDLNGATNSDLYTRCRFNTYCAIVSRRYSENDYD